MLAFITTLRHPQNSADYGRVESLLVDTLRSLTGQTRDDCIVIVVGNRRPAIPLPARTQFVEVDFPPPTGVNGVHASREQFVWDKGTKVGIGLAAARAHTPDHVMLVDADDFVHRDLVAFVSDRATSEGWVVTEGFVYSRARGVIRRQDGFNGVCGTCLVVPWDVYEVPDTLDTDATQDEVGEAFGDKLHRIMGAHRDAISWFVDRGRPLTPVPFRAAVYQVDTGENHSGKQLAGLAAPVGPQAARNFGLPATGALRRAVVSNVRALRARTLRPRAS